MAGGPQCKFCGRRQGLRGHVCAAMILAGKKPKQPKNKKERT